MDLTPSPPALSTTSRRFTHSSLLLLPPELRHQIYSYLLTLPASALTSYQRLSSLPHRSTPPPPTLTLHPSLLQTCRQIHLEATSLLYHSNTFCAHPRLLTSLPYLTSRARPVLSPRAAARIARWFLSVRLDADPGFSRADASAAFAGAKSLELEAWQAVFGGADRHVLTLFEGVRGVGSARVRGSVGRGYARWLEERMMLREGEEGGEWDEGAEGAEAYDVWVDGGR